MNVALLFLQCEEATCVPSEQRLGSAGEGGYCGRGIWEGSGIVCILMNAQWIVSVWTSKVVYTFCLHGCPGLLHHPADEVHSQAAGEGSVCGH